MINKVTPTNNFDFYRVDDQHCRHSHSCCQFVPQHILNDLQMFNGVSLDTEIVPTHFGALSNEPSLSQKKIIDIQPSVHMLRATRIQAFDHLKFDPSINASIGFGAVSNDSQPTKEPKFEVYDLDGATDLKTRQGIPEYKVALLGNKALLQLPIDEWPPSAKNAYNTAQQVYKFYQSLFNRNSIDGKGMDILSAVRLRTYVVYYDHTTQASKIATDQNGQPIRIPENNAFWDGAVMAYGEGDGMIFSDFTASKDVIGHELTHGVTEHACGLAYEEQSGALNEHISDVFGAIFRQWLKEEKDPITANWLIGDDCIKDDFKDMVKTRRFGHWNALRSMSEPGNAYSVTKGNSKGVDPQPSHMNNYKTLPNTREGDNGGVHINSGILNKAFHLFATKVGGPAWETPGKIWYQTIVDANFGKVNQGQRYATFEDFRNATVNTAKKDFQGAVQALEDAWNEVGL
ncbi:MAG: M4 family metallopeptidase [Parachlamydiaceae bacterium]|nr:M4 family metallopeptidase [Parachlamydiaceae bacterium]